MELNQQIGFGGGCHWCTEAVFQSLIGVKKVKQGWIASNGANSTFSEAVIIDYNAEVISLNILIEIHLHTHKSTVKHSMRKKYRSAIYVFDTQQQVTVNRMLEALQPKFNNKLITQVLRYSGFKQSRKEIINYYYKNPEKPFCKLFINPKLKLLLDGFNKYTNLNKTIHLVNVGCK